MRVLEAEKVTRTYHFVTTDETEWPEYRRWGPEAWERLMGESWESWYGEEELEAAFQKQQHGPVG